MDTFMLQPFLNWDMGKREQEGLRERVKGRGVKGEGLRERGKGSGIGGRAKAAVSG